MGQNIESNIQVGAIKNIVPVNKTFVEPENLSLKSMFLFPFMSH